MATERRAEAAWIDAKGYWEIKVQKDGTRKSFRSAQKGRKGKHEAEAKADEWLRKGTAEMRFEQAWEAFLEWQKKHTETANFKKHEYIGRVYLLPEMKGKRLSKIKPSMWQACIDAGVDAGLSRRSCSNIRASISTFLRHAKRERWEYIPIEDGDLRIPNAAAPEKTKRVLSFDDIRTLFSDPTIVNRGKIVTAHYIHAWRLCVLTGMRRGELCGLRNEDIGEESITIRRSINSFREETTGKNDNARRTFALTPEMKKVLSDQKEHLRQLGIESPWVFPDQYGECPVANNVYAQWETYRRQHGIQPSMHEMRHTFISLNKSDLPLELLKSVVGHSASMDTVKIYGHEVDDDQQRAAQIISNVFEKIINTEKVGGKVGG